MAAAGTGFSFGSTTTPAGSTGFSFGGATTTPAATGFSFGAAAPTTTASVAPTGFSFGSTAATTTAASGFSFGAAAATTAAGTGLFSGTAATTTTSTFGFGATSTATVAPTGTGLFSGLSKPATSSSFSLFGAKTTASTGLFGTATTATGLFGATSTAATTAATAAKPLENPKEAMVPNELTTIVTDLETYIKGQKDVKEEISKISSEGISTVREEIATLKQSISLIANSLQRDSVAAENLKLEVGQELKNAEVAQRIKDPYVGFHHDVAAPMEYFQRLVYSFETRINIYRQEIEELETFISSSISSYQFTPQDLSNVLKRLNDSFIGLASELQQVHESVKVIKEKYLHFRRVIYNDSFDPFVARKKLNEGKGKSNMTGPSPFPVIQGAGLMASAFKPEAKASTITFNNLPGFSSTFAKPAGSGLTRSLSFGSAKSTGFGGFGGGSSLFGKTTATTTSGFAFGATPSTASAPFTLQKPPSGKRGKLF